MGSIPTGRSITGGTQMQDVWILAFVFRGLVAAAGDPMPIADCEARMKDLDPTKVSHAVCINVQAPSCRVYRVPSPLHSGSDYCRTRLKKSMV